MTDGTRIGEVSHFYAKINVAVINLTRTLKAGDTIHFLGKNTDFKQEVTSMQVEHETISVAESNSEVALKTIQRVRSGDSVFLLSPEP